MEVVPASTTREPNGVAILRDVYKRQQLNILRGKSVVAATPAHMVDTGRSPSSSGYSITSDGNAAPSLSEIRLHGKKYVLEIGGDAAPETASTTK